MTNSQRYVESRLVTAQATIDVTLLNYVILLVAITVQTDAMECYVLNAS